MRPPIVDQRMGLRFRLYLGHEGAETREGGKINLRGTAMVSAACSESATSAAPSPSSIAFPFARRRASRSADHRRRDPAEINEGRLLLLGRGGRRGISPWMSARTLPLRPGPPQKKGTGGDPGRAGVPPSPSPAAFFSAPRSR